MTVRVGDVVRPNHKGVDIDWTVFRGRLVEVWQSAGTKGEPVGKVVWFHEAKRVIGRVTNGYALAMLTKA